MLSVGIFVTAVFTHRGGKKDISSVGEQPGNLPDRTLKRINENLKDLSIKKEILGREVDLDSSSATPIKDWEGTLPNGSDEEMPLPFSLDQENPAKKVLSDTDGRTERTKRPLTPDQRISKKIETEVWLRNEERRREREYIRQFIENAREQGYEIRLNENLDVVGIGDAGDPQPIRIPQSVSPGSGGK